MNGKLSRALDRLLDRTRELDPAYRGPGDNPWDFSGLDDDELTELEHLLRRWYWQEDPSFRKSAQRGWRTREEVVESSPAWRRHIESQELAPWEDPPVKPLSEPLSQEEEARLEFLLRLGLKDPEVLWREEAP